MKQEKGLIMKSLKVLFLSLLIVLALPVSANAKTLVNGGPYSNLKPTDQVIHLALSGFPTSNGLYILECAQSTDSGRPTLCNQAAQLWISKSQGANFAPTADIQFKPSATFISGSTSVDCTKLVCGIFIRLDHTAPTDTSEDQFIPLSFSTGSASGIVSDQITASINAVALSSANPADVKYRDVFKVEAVAKSGVTLTYASLAPACAISGNEVTVLKGTGYCDIAVTSAGNSQYAGVTSHFPLKLNPGEQKVSVITNSKPGTKLNLPSSTNFGESTTYSVAKSVNCSLKGNVLSLNKKGACALKVTAPGLADTYLPLKSTISIKIK
jgi:hypothetical protein